MIIRKSTTFATDYTPNHRAVAAVPMGQAVVDYRLPRWCASCGLGLAPGQTTSTCPRCDKGEKA